MDDSQYLSAQEAAELLGITTATLYSYVSRGLIRSEATASRARRYVAADVQALQERNAQRRNPRRAAARALRFGSPVLESRITLIEEGRLSYRGHDVLELVQMHTFEEVAALLWRNDFEWETLFDASQRAQVPDASVAHALAGRPPLDLFQTLLPLAAARDLAAYNTEPPAVAESGVRILRLLAWAITGEERVGPLAPNLARCWAPDSDVAPRLIDAALILCADHGLNISSFTARCVASAGSLPYMAVNAALCALRGHRHGGQTERVALFLNQARSDPATAVANHLRSGLSAPGYLPGFGHVLYPDGDPRGRYLIEAVRDLVPNAPILAPAEEVLQIARDELGIAPTVDFGLVLLAQALRLPDDAPLLIFTMGRTAGWIGQAIEEYQRDELIRPRAEYVGARPNGV